MVWQVRVQKCIYTKILESVCCEQKSPSRPARKGVRRRGRIVPKLSRARLIGSGLEGSAGSGHRDLLRTGWLASGRRIVLFSSWECPYAPAPKGTLRFRPPQELMPWEGILPAFRFGPVCPQIPAAFAPSSFYPQDEDCLSLNVWTPGIDDKRRPVLVFIHGGAFINGSSAESAYDGSTLSRRGDMVVVTANYRLGALGFLYLEDMDSEFAESGNLGLL